MRSFIAIALAASFCGPVTAQTITIKSFALGGDLKAEGARVGLICDTFKTRPDLGEYCSIRPFARPTEEVLTIAGLPAKKVFLMGYDNVLGRVEFHFDQLSFATLLAAVKERYPELKCASSTVANRMGASFDQTTCTLRDHRRHSCH